MMFTASMGITAFAAMDDEAAAELVFYAESTEMSVGDYIEVTLYIEENNVSDGIIGCDLPMFYDKSMLELSYQEVIVPESWGSYYRSLFNPGEGTDFCWLRVCYDPPLGEPFEPEKFAVTEDKGIGFTLVFTALKAGETTIEIMHKADDNVYMMLVNSELENFPPNGTTLDISITEGDASGDDASQEESASVETSTYDEESVSAELSENVDSSAVLEESVTVSSPETEESEEISTEDLSDGEVSTLVSVNSEETSDTNGNVVGEEQKPTDSQNKDDKKEEGGNTLIIILVIVVVVAVCGGIAAFYVIKNKKAKDAASVTDKHK